MHVTLAETLSNVTKLSILENPQYGGVSSYCHGCDKCCDWWF